MTKFQPEGQLIKTAENRHRLSSLAGIRDAMSRGLTVEGRAVRCDGEHNLHVDLECMQGILPREEGAIGIDDGSVRDIALISRVNKPVSCVITDIRTGEDGEPYAVLSRKKVQESCMTEFVSQLLPGDVIDARVCHMENFGVFLDIGAGINALLPIDSISVSRIPHPNVRFVTGQQVKVVVKNRDDLGRIILSHKELMGTWEQNAEQFKVGETVPGIVRSVEKYGVFIELTPNLAGLAEITDTVKAGDNACVYIKNILPERMKIKLIIVDSFCASYPAVPLKYYTTASHIDRWVYSPECCERTVESVFE